MERGDQGENKVMGDESERSLVDVAADRSGWGRRSWSAGRRPRLLKNLSRLGLVGLMLALPVMVSASHQFTDVPTSHTFHTVISRISGARLTTGCSSTRFCPNANVSRGQMAAFLARGLGRAGGGDFGEDDNDWTSLLDFTPVAAADLSTGGTSGGIAHAFATATVNVWTNEPNVCPCEVQAFLVNDTTGETSSTFFAMAGSEMTPEDPEDPDSPYSETILSTSYLFTVDSGVANEYLMIAKIIPTTAPTAPFVAGYRATMQAIYVPFSSTGGNPPRPTDTQGTPRGSRGD